jgi:hypothetical protein
MRPLLDGRIARKAAGLFATDAPVLLAVCVASVLAWATTRAALAPARPFVPLMLLLIVAGAFCGSLYRAIRAGR